MAEAAVLQARAMTDDPRQALDQLRNVAKDLEERRAYFELIEVLGGCARLADLCGDKQATADYMRSALLLAKGVGTTETLAVEIARAPSLEASIAQMPEAVQLRADLGLLREAQAQVKEDTYPGSGAPRQGTSELSVLTLGWERVSRDGKVITVKQWQAAAPRELFFYLLFNGPKNRADIELQFWPESNPQQVRSLFHTTLHRARAALGPNVLVFDDEMYSINSHLKIQCDAHQLESWTTQARLLPPHDARADDLWRKALSLYRGDFLRSTDATAQCRRCARPDRPRARDRSRRAARACRRSKSSRRQRHPATPSASPACRLSTSSACPNQVRRLRTEYRRCESRRRKSPRPE